MSKEYLSKECKNCDDEGTCGIDCGEVLWRRIEELEKGLEEIKKALEELRSETGAKYPDKTVVKAELEGNADTFAEAAKLLKDAKAEILAATKQEQASNPAANTNAILQQPGASEVGQ